MDFPKTLEIRNTPGGCIWQLYHVQSQKEVDYINRVATGNGFASVRTTEFQPVRKETFPCWRNEVTWTDKTCPRCMIKPCSCDPDEVDD